MKSPTLRALSTFYFALRFFFFYWHSTLYSLGIFHHITLADFEQISNWIFSLLLVKRKKSFFHFSPPRRWVLRKRSWFQSQILCTTKHTVDYPIKSLWRLMAMLIEHSGPFKDELGWRKIFHQRNSFTFFFLLHFSHTPEQSRGWIRNI